MAGEQGWYLQYSIVYSPFPWTFKRERERDLLTRLSTQSPAFTNVIALPGALLKSPEVRFHPTLTVLTSVHDLSSVE